MRSFGRGSFGGTLWCLLVDERRHPFRCKNLCRHFVDILCGNFINVLVQCVDIFFPSIMQETFAKVEGKVLPIVAGHAYLPLELFLGCMESRRGDG